MWVVWSVLTFGCLCAIRAAVPDPPSARTTTIGARKLGTVADCHGIVAFAASNGNINDARLILSETLVDKGVGYVAETGTFTTHCPGLYQFSFAGYGSDDLGLTLKLKNSISDGWSPVTSVGPGGGSNLVLLTLEIGDQLAVFVDSGKVTNGATFTDVLWDEDTDDIRVWKSLGGCENHTENI